MIEIGHERVCNNCKPNALNCLTGKEWIKDQIGIWEVNYEGRDIRDKDQHPATFPIELAKRVISLFTHEGELVIDPFVGSGTTLVAAQDLGRNAVGFDLKEEYVDLAISRLCSGTLLSDARQTAVHSDAINMSEYIAPETVSLIWTSPPYANLLMTRRKNKSTRSDLRKNYRYNVVDQYSQDPRDLGTMEEATFVEALGDVLESALPLLKPKAHCVINITDAWIDGERVALHVSIVNELRRRGYELRNTMIWDRRNIVQAIGIFGYPSNYITMGTTFEYILDFWKPEE